MILTNDWRIANQAESQEDSLILWENIKFDSQLSCFFQQDFDPIAYVLQFLSTYDSSDAIDLGNKNDPTRHYLAYISPRRDLEKFQAGSTNSPQNEHLNSYFASNASRITYNDEESLINHIQPNGGPTFLSQKITFFHSIDLCLNRLESEIRFQVAQHQPLLRSCSFSVIDSELSVLKLKGHLLEFGNQLNQVQMQQRHLTEGLRKVHHLFSRMKVTCQLMDKVEMFLALYCQLDQLISKSHLSDTHFQPEKNQFERSNSEYNVKDETRLIDLPLQFSSSLPRHHEPSSAHDWVNCIDHFYLTSSKSDLFQVSEISFQMKQLIQQYTFSFNKINVLRDPIKSFHIFTDVFHSRLLKSIHTLFSTYHDIFIETMGKKQESCELQRQVAKIDVSKLNDDPGPSTFKSCAIYADKNLVESRSFNQHSLIDMIQVMYNLNDLVGTVEKLLFSWKLDIHHQIKDALTSCLSIFSQQPLLSSNNLNRPTNTSSANAIIINAQLKNISDHVWLNLNHLFRSQVPEYLAFNSSLYHALNEFRNQLEPMIESESNLSQNLHPSLSTYKRAMTYSQYFDLFNQMDKLPLVKISWSNFIGPSASNLIGYDHYSHFLLNFWNMILDEICIFFKQPWNSPELEYFLYFFLCDYPTFLDFIYDIGRQFIGYKKLIDQHELKKIHIQNKLNTLDNTTINSSEELKGLNELNDFYKITMQFETLLGEHAWSSFGALDIFQLQYIDIQRERLLQAWKQLESLMIPSDFVIDYNLYLVKTTKLTTNHLQSDAMTSKWCHEILDFLQRAKTSPYPPPTCSTLDRPVPPGPKESLNSNFRSHFLPHSLESSPIFFCTFKKVEKSKLNSRLAIVSNELQSFFQKLRYALSDIAYDVSPFHYKLFPDLLQMAMEMIDLIIQNCQIVIFNPMNKKKAAKDYTLSHPHYSSMFHLLVLIQHELITNTMIPLLNYFNYLFSSCESIQSTLFSHQGHGQQFCNLDVDKDETCPRQIHPPRVCQYIYQYLPGYCQIMSYWKLLSSRIQRLLTLLVQLIFEQEAKRIEEQLSCFELIDHTNERLGVESIEKKQHLIHQQPDHHYEIEIPNYTSPERRFEVNRDQAIAKIQQILNHFVDCLLPTQFLSLMTSNQHDQKILFQRIDRICAILYQRNEDHLKDGRIDEPHLHLSPSVLHQADLSFYINLDSSHERNLAKSSFHMPFDHHLLEKHFEILYDTISKSFVQIVSCLCPLTKNMELVILDSTARLECALLAIRLFLKRDEVSTQELSESPSLYNHGTLHGHDLAIHGTNQFIGVSSISNQETDLSKFKEHQLHPDEKQSFSMQPMPLNLRNQHPSTSPINQLTLHSILKDFRTILFATECDLLEASQELASSRAENDGHVVSISDVNQIPHPCERIPPNSVEPNKPCTKTATTTTTAAISSSLSWLALALSHTEPLVVVQLLISRLFPDTFNWSRPGSRFHHFQEYIQFFNGLEPSEYWITLKEMITPLSQGSISKDISHIHDELAKKYALIEKVAQLLLKPQPITR